MKPAGPATSIRNVQVNVPLKWLYPSALVGFAAYIYPVDRVDAATAFLVSLFVAWAIS